MFRTNPDLYLLRDKLLKARQARSESVSNERSLSVQDCRSNIKSTQEGAQTSDREVASATVNCGQHRAFRAERAICCRRGEAKRAAQKGTWLWSGTGIMLLLLEALQRAVESIQRRYSTRHIARAPHECHRRRRKWKLYNISSSLRWIIYRSDGLVQRR